MEPNLEQIRKRREENFRNMGVAPTFTQEQVQQVAQHMPVKNMDARDRINAIKNGALRDEISVFNRAKGSNLDTQEFRPQINPRNPKYQEYMEQKNNAIKKNGLDARPVVDDAKSREARGIEAMFDTDGPSMGYTGDVVMGNDWEQRRQQVAQSSQNQVPPPLVQQPPVSDVIFKDTGSWEQSFMQKKREALAQQQNQPQSTYGQQPNYQQPTYNQSQFDFNSILEKMEDIIAYTVDKKLKEALSKSDVKESASSNKTESKNTFRLVKDKQGNYIPDIISINGEFYEIKKLDIKSKK